MAEYWNEIYRTKPEDELSWHQKEPTLSLTLVRRVATPASRILDVGGGTSPLAGRLVQAGFRDVTVLDLSETAILRNQARVGALAPRIHWIAGDVLRGGLRRRFDVWHDRAAFHFLGDPRDRERYERIAEKTIPPGGWLIVATFALDGPEMCSGLPVERYDGPRLSTAFSRGFVLRESARETHTTPWGTAQRFTFGLFERVESAKAKPAPITPPTARRRVRYPGRTEAAKGRPGKGGVRQRS